ncbi:hypothetical protein BGV71_13910 [Burkholderia ubonensis]|nr:hypothetical protein BGV71_13910 [Burkholderia ubonensis]
MAHDMDQFVGNMVASAVVACPIYLLLTLGMTESQSRSNDVFLGVGLARLIALCIVFVSSRIAHIFQLAMQPFFGDRDPARVANWGRLFGILLGLFNGAMLIVLQCLLTVLVERISRAVRLAKMPDATAASAPVAFTTKLRSLVELMRQTLTYDQGRETARHAELSAATNVRVYFCDPYSPWQRETCENANDLLRQ